MNSLDVIIGELESVDLGRGGWVPRSTAQRVLAAAWDLAGIATRQAARLAAIEDLVDQACKISPSGSMSVYVSDVQRALGEDVDRAHKLGQADR